MTTRSEQSTERLEVALRAGAVLLENGAETWRTEDTMRRLLDGLGARHIEVVGTATALFASVLDENGPQTRVRRVRGGALNLARIDEVNVLSRQTVQQQLSRRQVAQELARIETSAPLYPFPVTLLGALGAALGFAILFGGGWHEMLLTLPGALVLSLLGSGLARTPLPALAATVLASLAGTLVAALAARQVPDAQANIVILSTVVLLVPGAAIVNAIGDLLGGHLLSGLARGAAAMLVAAAIATGVVVGLRLTGTWLR